MTDNKSYPAELVDLPSKGWFYDPKSPLAAGKVNLRYMTARDEDILTSRNLINKGVVMDRLLDALLVDRPAVQQDDLLQGDWNALTIAARVLGYGKNYEANVTCPQCKVVSVQDIDLEELKDKDVEFLPEQKGKNEFVFTLPASGQVITFKLLTHGDVKKAEKELEAMQKMIKGGSTTEVTTRMAYSILSVDGISEKKELREFIGNMMARDAMAWRDYASKINPNVDMHFDFECSRCEFAQDRMEVPIDINFFWPQS